MSVSATAIRAFEPASRLAPSKSERAASGASSRAELAVDALNSIATYLPTEGIMVYLTITGIGSANKANGLVLAIFAAAAALLVNSVLAPTVYAVVARKQKTNGAPSGGLRQTLWAFVLTLVYVLALQANFLSEISGKLNGKEFDLHLEPMYGTFFAVIVAALAPYLAGKLGIVMKPDAAKKP